MVASTRKPSLAPQGKPGDLLCAHLGIRVPRDMSRGSEEPSIMSLLTYPESHTQSLPLDPVRLTE